MTGFLSYQLKPEALELRFREERLAQDRIQAITLMALTLLILISFIVLDVRFLPTGLALSASIISRGVTFLLTGLAVWSVYRQSAVKSFDRNVIGWGMVLILHMLIINAVRPADYIAVLAWDILVIMGAYIATPIPVRLQIILAIFLSSGSALLWFAHTMPSGITFENVTVLAAFIYANIFGIFVSGQLSRAQRKQFVLFEHEHQAKEALAEALAEIKTLRGVIPICASCKNIRDDEGYWNELEIYIRDHSEVDFSHSICPDCMQKLYPEQYREMGQRREEIVAVLKKLGQASLSEIASMINAPESNTANRLRMMVEEGQVKCLEVARENRYSLEPETH